MQFKVGDEALRAMSERARTEQLTKLVRATRGLPNGELTSVREQIAVFEKRYETPSERMREEVEAGTRKETWEICQWLMLLNRRSRLEKRASRAE